MDLHDLVMEKSWNSIVLKGAGTLNRLKCLLIRQRISTQIQIRIQIKNLIQTLRFIFKFGLNSDVDWNLDSF